MSITSIGDLAQFTQSLRQTGSIKSRMLTLGQELSSGRKSDLSTASGGRNAPLAQINRELEVIEGYLRTGKDLESRLSSMQIVLDDVDVRRSNLVADMAISLTSSAGSQPTPISQNARQAMTDVVHKLNGTHNGSALFAGRATDTIPLIPAEDMLADIALTLTAASTADDIKTAVDDWFDGPTGFATMGYTGDTGAALSQRLNATETLSLDARADEAGMRDTLKGLAHAALADVLGVSDAVQVDVIEDSMATLISAGDTSVKLRGRIGGQEERLAQAMTSHQLQVTLLSSDRNDIVLADPFETATLLQDVQRQLELHFTSTTRLAQLSLVNYL